GPERRVLPRRHPGGAVLPVLAPAGCDRHPGGWDRACAAGDLRQGCTDRLLLHGTAV
ncbi:MAG: hypothetical protein AVDCRST_MAG25-564, partial [uncultured Rubrobacteraceae bacterium]